MSTTRNATLLGLGLYALANTAAAAPIPVATWSFNDTLAADDLGDPALTAIDPLGQSGFMTDTVFGESRRVWRFAGDGSPAANQAGLSVSANGLLDADNAYSVEMVFQFEANQASWEMILGVSNRQSDNAFYVEPGNHLQVYPVGGGPNVWTFGEYHHVTMTNDGAGHVTAYLDGVFQFDLTTNVMDFSTYGVPNPNRLLHFFADNIAGGGQGEFADGRVALIRLYDIELASDDVGDLGGDPFATVPEPGSLALLGLGLAAGIRRRTLRP